MRTVLIDGDIEAFKSAARNEEEYFGVVHADPEGAIRNVREEIAKLTADVGADRAIVCLSDPRSNWRKTFEPTYKAFRGGTKKPQLIMHVKDFLYREYGANVRPNLEADDVMGILATAPNLLAQGEMVISSDDKDMRTIPGFVYHPNRPSQGIMEISQFDADRFHLWQTIVGDPTDGYTGAPGVGKGSIYADAVLHEEDPLDAWDCVLEAYFTVGLTEADAVKQARMARILRFHDWNPLSKKVRLWNPTFLLH